MRLGVLNVVAPTGFFPATETMGVIFPGDQLLEVYGDAKRPANDERLGAKAVCAMGLDGGDNQSFLTASFR